MEIFKFVKKLFSKKEKQVETTNTKEEIVADNVRTLNIKVEKGLERSVDEKLKMLRRKKYTHSTMSLDNNLECEILNYLLARETSSFNIYWNLYVPYGENRYMQLDFVVVTGDTVYVIESKEYKTCTSIEDLGEQWRCYYNSGRVYENANGLDQNNKHVNVIKKYLGDDSFNYKSVVALVVSDDFNADLSDDDLIIVRASEFEILFRMLDRRIVPSKCDECISNNFVSFNEMIYDCMNVSDEVIDSHRKRIEDIYV